MGFYFARSQRNFPINEYEITTITNILVVTTSSINKNPLFKYSKTRCQNTGEPSVDSVLLAVLHCVLWHFIFVRFLFTFLPCNWLVLHLVMSQILVLLLTPMKEQKLNWNSKVNVFITCGSAGHEFHFRVGRTIRLSTLKSSVIVHHLSLLKWCKSSCFGFRCVFTQTWLVVDRSVRPCFTMCWLFGPIEMTCTLIIQPIFHFVFYEIPVYIGAHSKVMHFFLKTLWASWWWK